MRLTTWFGAALAVGSGFLALEAQAQANKFDGRWSVEVITESGGCDRAYRYSVMIEDGKARYGGQEAFTVTGQVVASGAVNATISHGQDRAEVTGRLEGNLGTGTWKAAGTSRTCAGRWNAEKRG
ncbi:MAG TPA: hypothetical protein VHL98_10610 [Microvirga sp.]|jgi:hypothetical protein|nr:hypothetical protein [Microvirga sp.]